MRYNYKFKVECVESYRNGVYPETPEGVSQMSFRSKVRQWSRLVELHGYEALRPMTEYRKWSPDEKIDLIMQVKAGQAVQSVALENKISEGMLHQWVRKYDIWGYNGLVNKKSGRTNKEPLMKKKSNPAPLTESEREELIRLRAEIKYIQTENEVIKKEIALREEKEAARLKAKKQRLSRNSANKDTN